MKCVRGRTVSSPIRTRPTATRSPRASTVKPSSTSARPASSSRKTLECARGPVQPEEPDVFAKKVSHHFLNKFGNLNCGCQMGQWVEWNFIVHIKRRIGRWFQVPRREAAGPQREPGGSSALPAPDRLPEVLHLPERCHPTWARLRAGRGLQHREQPVRCSRECGRLVQTFFVNLWILISFKWIKIGSN